MFLITFFSVISTIVVICIATPIFMVVILPLGIIYVLVQVRTKIIVCCGFLLLSFPPPSWAGLLTVISNKRTVSAQRTAT